MADGKIAVHQGGGSVVVQTDFGLRLTYDTRAGVVLTLPSTYGGALRGLCGDFNGDPSDDFTLAGRPGEPSAGAFIAAWTAKDLPCQPGCSGPTCPGAGGGEDPKREHCDIIKSTQGPLAGCHGAVPPRPYFEACVRQVLSPMSYVLSLMSYV